MNNEKNMDRRYSIAALFVALALVVASFGYVTHSAIADDFVAGNIQDDNYTSADVVTPAHKQLIDEHEATVAELEAANTEIGTLEAEVSNLEDQVATAQSDRDTYKSQVSSLQGQVKSLNTTVESQKGEINTLNATVSKVTAELNTANATIEKQKGTISTQTTTINSQKSAITKKDSEIANLKKAAASGITVAQETRAVMVNYLPNVKLTTAKKAVTASWQKLSSVNSPSYQVRYKTAGGKWVVKNTTATKLKATSLKAKKTYTFQVRGSSLADGQRVWGNWSPAQTVKTK